MVLRVRNINSGVKILRHLEKKTTELSPEARAFIDEVDQLAGEVLVADKELAMPISREHAKRMKTLANVFYVVVVVLGLLVGFVLLLNRYASNGILGMRFFVEQTNAMNTTVPRGSLLVTVTRSSEKIKKNDIITYYAVQTDPDTRLTRIVDECLKTNGIPFFRTRRAGSAQPDSMLINMTNILGVKLAIIPYAGYVISFIQTYAYGFAVLAAAMCVAAIALRRWSFKEHPEMKKKRKKKNKGKVRHADV